MLTIISTSGGKEVKNKGCPSKWSTIELYGSEFAKGQDGGSSVAFRYFFFFFWPDFRTLYSFLSRTLPSA